MIEESLWARNRCIQGLQANHTTTSWHFVGDVCSFALFMHMIGSTIEIFFKAGYSVHRKNT